MVLKDEWLNTDYEEELVPFAELPFDISDQRLIDTLVGDLGFNRAEVEDSLRSHKFDDPYASYLLLLEETEEEPREWE